MKNVIRNQEDIRDIFNIFHDGDIIEHFLSKDGLCLVIDIPYLAERINDTYTKFNVMLYGCKDVAFTPWSRQQNTDTEVMTDIHIIFGARHWILDAAIDQNKIIVSCLQNDDSLDYSGGELILTVNSAIVTDENKKEYTIKELSDLSRAYWNEWEKAQ